MIDALKVLFYGFVVCPKHKAGGVRSVVECDDKYYLHTHTSLLHNGSSYTERLILY